MARLAIPVESSVVCLQRAWKRTKISKLYSTHNDTKTSQSKLVGLTQLDSSKPNVQGGTWQSVKNTAQKIIISELLFSSG